MYDSFIPTSGPPTKVFGVGRLSGVGSTLQTNNKPSRVFQGYPEETRQTTIVILCRDPST